VQSLEVDRPRITIVREADGSLNLPEIAQTEDEAESAPPGPLRIDRLVIRDLNASYGDASLPLSVDGRGVTLDLDSTPGAMLAGRLSMSDGVELRLGDRETAVSTLEGGLAFDGTALSVDALTLQAPEARLRLDGTLGLLADEQRIDMRYEGRLDAARIAPWVGLDPLPSGHVAVSGTAQGPLAEPDVRLEVSTDGLAWSTLGALSLDARAAMSGSSVALESFRARLAGGEVTGAARLQFGAEGTSNVTARFQDLNLGTLASVVPDLPVRVASVAGGDVALEWTGQDLATAEGKILTRLRAPTVQRGAMGLEGQLGLELARGAWTLTLDQRVADTIVLRGGATGRLAAGNIAASTLGGRVRLEIESLPDALRRIAAAGLGGDAQLAERVRGALTANLDLDGTFDDPSAVGTLDVGELWLDDTGPGAAHADVRASRRTISVESLELTIGPNSLRGRVAIGLDTNALDGEVTGDLPELAPLALMVPEEWRPEGSTRFEAELGGTLDNPGARLALSSRDLRVAGQTLKTVESRVRLADQIVTVDELVLTQDEGRLAATGRYEIASERYTFEATGNGFAITPLIQGQVADDAGTDAAPVTFPLDAQFDLRLAGEGTLAAPGARGFIQFSHLDWDRYRLGAARADVVVENGSALISASVPSANGTLKADVAIDAPRAFTFEVEVAAVRLSDVVRPTGPAGTPEPEDRTAIDPADIVGALGLNAVGYGQLDDLPGATVDLDLSLLDVAINDAPLRLDRPARLRYAARELVAEDVELRIGSSTLSARGALIPGVAATSDTARAASASVPRTRMVIWPVTWSVHESAAA
jgi:hypothetical protein